LIKNDYPAVDRPGDRKVTALKVDYEWAFGRPLIQPSVQYSVGVEWLSEADELWLG
jgi:hypothetical protein